MIDPWFNLLSLIITLGLFVVTLCVPLAAAAFFIGTLKGRIQSLERRIEEGIVTRPPIVSSSPVEARGDENIKSNKEEKQQSQHEIPSQKPEIATFRQESLDRQEMFDEVVGKLNEHIGNLKDRVILLEEKQLEANGAPPKAIPKEPLYL